MMGTTDKLDLDNISKIIASKKEERTKRSELLGEKTNVPVRGDEFLKELRTSIIRGEDTPASIHVKTVNEATMVKDGDKVAIDPKLLKHVNQNPIKINPPQQQAYNPPQQQAYNPPQQQAYNPNQQTGFKQQAESNLYAEIQRKQNELFNLQQGKNPYVQKPTSTQPPMMTEGGQQYIPAGSNMLTEQVNIAFNRFLNEDLSGVLQEAMRSSIVETYKMERVKEALLENEDVIAKIVIKVIRDLQKRNTQQKTK